MNDGHKSEPPKPSGAQMARTNDLRARAEDYLESPRIISEPGASLTRLIARYVAGEPWDDPELESRLSECIRTAQTEAARWNQATTGPDLDAWHFY